MANEQGKKKEAPKEKVRLLRGPIEKDKQTTKVQFEAQAIKADGKANTDCAISFFDDKFTVLHSAQADAQGKVPYTYEAETKKLPKKLTVRAQIDGSAAESSETVEFESALSIYTLRLMTSRAKEEETVKKKTRRGENLSFLEKFNRILKSASGFFRIMFRPKLRLEVWAEALVANPDKIGAKGVKVEFFGNNPRDILATKTTDKHGRALVPLSFNPRFEGDKLIIHARIQGTNIEFSDETYLLPDYKSGFERTKKVAFRNWYMKSAKIWSYLALTFAINTVAYFVLYSNAGGKSASVLIGLMVGALLIFFINDRNVGIISALTVIFVSWFFPQIVVISLKHTIWFIVGIGIPFYLLEELSYQPRIEMENEKPRIEWNKMKNFYPYYPIGIAGAMIVINLIQLINTFIGPEIEAGMALTAQEYFNPGSSAGKIFSGARQQFMDIIQWVVGAAILFVYAAPGEFLGIFKAGGQMHHGFGLGVFLDKIWEWVRRLFSGVFRFAK